MVETFQRVPDWEVRFKQDAEFREIVRELQKARERPDIENTTTTNRYLSYPALATGISKASSGSTAWSLSAWTEVVPANTITATFYFCGFCFNYTNNAALDVTHGVIFEFGDGAGGSEVMKIQVPTTIRIDSAVGHQPTPVIILPEPREFPANTRISVRVSQSLATTVITYAGIKILYQIP